MAADKTERDPYDAYYTPRWLVKRAMIHVMPHIEATFPGEDFPTSILEPSAGTGRFVSALRERYPHANIDAVEPRRSAAKIIKGADLVLNTTIEEVVPHIDSPYDLIIGNPPYKLAQRHIEMLLPHCRAMLLLLRSDFSGSAKRASFFWDNTPSGEWVVPDRPAFDRPNMKQKQTDQYNYSFLAWTPENTVRFCAKRWLPALPLDERRN